MKEDLVSLREEDMNEEENRLIVEIADALFECFDKTLERMEKENKKMSHKLMDISWIAMMNFAGNVMEIVLENTRAEERTNTLGIALVIFMKKLGGNMENITMMREDHAKH